MVPAYSFSSHDLFLFFPVWDSNISIQVKYLSETILGMVGKYLFENLNKKRIKFDLSADFHILGQKISSDLDMGTTVAFSLQNRPFGKTVMWTKSPVEHNSMRKQVIFCQAHSRHPNMAQFCTGGEIITVLLPCTFFFCFYA